MNPVLLKEMRSMLRERRGWLVPMLYAAVLAAAVALFVMPQLLTPSGGGGPRQIGQFLVGLVAVVQAGVLAVFAPLVGAALVAGEREQSTWLSLLASSVSRRAITTGKLTAGFLYVLLLMSVSAPVTALGLLMGAVDLPTILGLYLAQGALGVALVSLGMAVSTLFQRTWTAGLASVGLTLALTVVSLAFSTTFAAILALASFQDRSTLALLPLAFNPFYGTFLFLGGPTGELMGGHPWFQHFLALGLMTLGATGFAAGRMSRARE